MTSTTLGGEWIWWASVVAGGIYVLTAIFVVVSRLRFERQRRLIALVESLLAGASSSAAAGANRNGAMTALTSAPVSILWAIAADSSIPTKIHQLVARSLLERVGTERLCEIAGAGGASDGLRRIAALRALALTEAADAWRLLALALTDSNPEVVGATISLLGEIEDRRSAVLLVDALRAGRYLRSRISTALEALSGDISDLLAPLLSSDDAATRYWGVMLIKRFPGTPGLASTVEAMTADEQPLVRKAALYAMPELGGAGAAVAAQRCLSDPVHFVRVYAARALGMLPAPDRIHALVPLLADRDWWVRSAVKQILEQSGETVEDALIPYLSHPDAFARNGAAEVLQNTGAFERMLLLEATGPSDPHRLSVINTLAQAGGLRMWDSVLLRLPPTSRARARELLTETLSPEVR